LADVLAADPAVASRWPLSVEGPDGPRWFAEPTEFGFTRVLRGFQAAQAARLLRAGDGCNFSVPGSGKTTVGYAVFGALRAAGAVERALVVAPISAHETWQVEALNCLAPGRAPRVAVLPPRPVGEVVVVHYEALQDSALLASLVGWLRTSRSLVVFDEAHRAKAGRAGVRGTAALALAAVADHRFVLTGTPAPNGPQDVAALFDLAWPGSGRALWTDPRNSRCFVLATKSDLRLPPQTLEVQRVPLSAAHRRLYDAMVSAAAAALADADLRRNLARIGRIVLLLLQGATDPAALLDPQLPLTMSGDVPDTALSELARRASANVVPGKFVRVRQLVDANAAAGHKTLVWASFRHHIDALERLLAAHQPAVVVGDTSRGPERYGQLEAFRTDPDCHVLLATPQTLGEGVSLHQTCQRQIHVDRTYNAGVFLQSLDRTHRLGLPPDADCRVTLLVAEETIDEQVESRLSRKVAQMAAMLDDPDLVGLSVPDVDDTLSPIGLLLGTDAGEALADLFDLAGDLLQGRGS